MIEGNVNEELVGIPTEDGVKNIHPDLLKGWRQDAFEQLRKADGVKAELKLLAETVEESTGIKKGVIAKWFKAQYKTETKKTKSLGETFEALDELIPEAGYEGS